MTQRLLNRAKNSAELLNKFGSKAVYSAIRSVLSEFTAYKSEPYISLGDFTHHICKESHKSG